MRATNHNRPKTSEMLFSAALARSNYEMEKLSRSPVNDSLLYPRTRLKMPHRKEFILIREIRGLTELLKIVCKIRMFFELFGLSYDKRGVNRSKGLPLCL